MREERGRACKEELIVGERMREEITYQEEKGRRIIEEGRLFGPRKAEGQRSVTNGKE